MKRISYIAIFTAAAMLAASCQSEPQPLCEEDSSVYFQPFLESNGPERETKTSEITSVDGSISIPLSCEVFDGIDGDVAVCSGRPEGPQTKGQLYNDHDDNGKDVPLANYSTELGGKFYVAAWEFSKSFIPAYKEVTEGTDGFWTTADTYLWLPSKELTFYAYANLPAIETGVVEASVNCQFSTKQTLDYSVVPTDATKQKDILMGFYSGAAKYDETARRGGIAELKFYHPLTAVRFKKGTFEDLEGNSLSVSFKSISIQGVYDSGTTDLLPANIAKADPGEKFVWNTSGSSTKTVAIAAASDEFLTVGSDLVIGGESFLLIPQNLTSNSVKVTVVAEIGGASRTFEVLLANGGWEAGKTYTYTLGYDGSSYSYIFSLANSQDDLQIFSNTVDPASRTIDIKSYKLKSDGTRSEVNWTIKNVKIGSAPEESIAAASFTDKGGLSSSAELSNKRLSLTALTRLALTRGSNDFWTNRDGISGDTDGSGWSPKSWGSDGLNKGVIDLSKYDPYTDTPNAHDMTTANCYIIRHAGTYKLPLVYGNGVIAGFKNSSSYFPNVTGGTHRLDRFHNHLGSGITDPFIENNASCTLPAVTSDLNFSDLWQDEAIVVRNLEIVGSPAGSYDKDNVRYLQFTISQDDICQNNALIAINDGSGNIMWSWHIWTTNDPALISGAVPVNNHAGNVYNFFPLNVLGWIEPVIYPARDDVKIVLEQEESGKTLIINVSQPEVTNPTSGCYYQFGRKDPMSRKDTPFAGDFYRSSGPVSLATAVLHPDTYYAKGSEPNDWSSTTYDNLWTGRLSQYALVDEGADLIKTIYDPSPVGYKMPASNAFTGFTTTGAETRSLPEFNVIGEFDNGWKFKTGYGDATIFFPAAGYRSGSSGNMARIGEYGNFWSAVNRSANDGYCLKFESNEFLDPVHPYYWRSHAFAVRPVTYEPVLNILGTGPEFNDYDDKGDKDITF